MPFRLRNLIFITALSIPSVATALSLGALRLVDAGNPFHAQVVVQLSADESWETLRAKLAQPNELPPGHRIRNPINANLALAITPIGDKQGLLDIRGDSSEQKLPFSFLLELRLNNGLMLKQYDVLDGGLLHEPRVTETLLSHILSYDAGEENPGIIETEPKPLEQYKHLQLELAQARLIEKDLKQQNQILQNNLQHMEQLASEIAQQLGLFAEIRQQQMLNNSETQPVFIDQNATASTFNDTSLGGISVLALLLAGFAFREKLKVVELLEFIKRWSRNIFNKNRPA